LHLLAAEHARHTTKPLWRRTRWRVVLARSSKVVPAATVILVHEVQFEGTGIAGYRTAPRPLGTNFEGFVSAAATRWDHGADQNTLLSLTNSKQGPLLSTASFRTLSLGLIRLQSCLPAPSDQELLYAGGARRWLRIRNSCVSHRAQVE
jgi:hypothetical protein